MTSAFELLAGFLIAVIIALTGVGAGTITAPLLILFLRVSPDVAVGTALAYSAIVKLIVAPVQIIRRQVNWRILAFMLAGGLPGVVAGWLLFRKVENRGNYASLYWVLGAIIIFSSGWHIYRYFVPAPSSRTTKDRPRIIAVLMLPIGAEVGFSSSGAGALGTAVLLSLTSLTASQVVGTDLVFGLGVSLVGGGVHILSGNYDPMLLARLILGGIVGAIVGSGIATRIPARQLRFVLSLWLVILGIEFWYRAAKF
jgi:uncharacterized membrane protein YfcA